MSPPEASAPVPLKSQPFPNDQTGTLTPESHPLPLYRAALGEMLSSPQSEDRAMCPSAVGRRDP